MNHLVVDFCFSRVNQFRLSFKKILPVVFGIESLFHSQVLGLPLVDNFDKAKQLIRLSKVEGNPILQGGRSGGKGSLNGHDKTSLLFVMSMATQEALLTPPMAT